MKLNKEKLFIGVSIIFLSTLIIIYGWRFIYYYRLEKSPAKQNKSLVNVLIDSSNLVSSGSGLYKSNDEYIYKGQAENNYLLYSGYLWRIIKVNADNTIKLITDDLITSLVWNYDSNDYLNSHVYKWLNPVDEVSYSGIFYNSLDNASEVIVSGKFCVDKINDLNKLTCDKVDNSKVGLLELLDYKIAGGKNSYLYKQNYEWTMSSFDEKQVWFRLPTGQLSNKSFFEDSYYSYGVRPVITIKGDVILNSGNGTKENPYIIESKIINNFSDIRIGQYISYSNYKWKVISKDETKVKVVMDGYIKDKDKFVLLSFSQKSNKFNLSNKDDLGYYLNHTFYKTLTNQDYLVEGDWSIGNYNYEVDYDYTNVLKETIKAKVGLLSVGDLFINEYDGYATITPTNIVNETIYTILSDGRLYADEITKELKVRPALYLDINLKISEGEGTKEKPFIINR